METKYYAFPSDGKGRIPVTKVFAILGPQIPKYDDWIFFEEVKDVGTDAPPGRSARETS